MAHIKLPPQALRAAKTIEEPKQAFGTTKTIEEQWQELYRTACNSQQGAWYVDCRINKGMTPEQAREYVAANWTYKEIIITPEDAHRSTVVNRLKRIKSIQVLHGMTPPWAEEVYKEARKLGIISTPIDTDTDDSIAQSATAANKKTEEEKKIFIGSINMKHKLLKNIIAANSELIKNHNKNVIINPICYYLTIEYISQGNGYSFTDIVKEFEEQGIEFINNTVNSFFYWKRQDYEPDLSVVDLYHYRVQKMTEIRNSQESMETELALFDVYEDNYRSYKVARMIVEQKRNPQAAMNSDNIKLDFSRTNIWLGILKASIVIRLPEDSKYKDMSIVKAQKEIVEKFLEEEDGIMDLNKCAKGNLRYDALTFLNRATVALGNSNIQK